MKIVLDSNVLISGFLWGGPPAEVLARVERGEDRLFTTRALLGEIVAVINRPKFQAVLEVLDRSPHELVAWVADRAIVVIPKPLPQIVVVDDPSDDCVLACASTVGVDYVVSGNRHLLDIGSFEGIPILPPAEYLRKADRTPHGGAE